jgi:hypothetical protein
MAYSPPNRIKTDLYTEGNEFIFIDNGDWYEGFYWKNFQERFFTGKTPNDRPTREIIRQEPLEDPGEIATQDNIKFTRIMSADNAFQENVDNYVVLQKKDFYKIKLLPVQFYPKPTKEDYQLGIIQRYFSVKQNENIYLEIDKETSDKLAQHDDEWDWESYATFRIQWTITGDERDVFRANYNSVVLKERDLKDFVNRTGFKNFLRGEYLKFYKSRLDI